MKKLRFSVLICIGVIALICIGAVLFFLFDGNEDELNYVEISNDRLSELTGWNIPDSIEIEYSVEYESDSNDEEHPFCLLEAPLFIKATINESDLDAFLNHIRESSSENFKDGYSDLINTPEAPPFEEADYAFYHFNPIECMSEDGYHKDFLTDKDTFTELYIYKDGEQVVMYFSIVELDRRTPAYTE